MGLFDKKYCDVCGEKIGLLGNRKLEDGNLCKDCAAKLSPLFSGRRSATVEEIKNQLAYREENKQKLASFCPSRTFGESNKIYIDDAAGAFIYTNRSNWKDANPDIISLSQVTACNTKIEENKDEIFRETSDGNQESYNPPRYEYSYEFKVEILINSPWFGEIEFELSEGNRPDSRYTDAYREYERQMYELSAALTGKGAAPQANYAPQGAQNFAQGAQGFAQGAQGAQGFAQGAAFGAAGAAVATGAAAQAPAAQTPAAAWVCPSCGAQNSGAFCQNCGTKKPEAQREFQCDKCGWKPDPGAQVPKFCPQCGDPFDANDVR